MQKAETIARVANNMYGDRVMTTFDDPLLKVLIHYPQIKIRNTKDEEHDIHDLFVGVRMDTSSQRYLVQTIKGMRTSFTVAELVNGYIHSHLPGRRGRHMMTFQEFCTGNWFNDVSRQLGDSDDTEAMAFLFFEKLNHFVQWESIAGTPYWLMKNIKVLNPVEETTLFSTHRFKRYIRNSLVTSEEFRQLLNFRISGSKVRVRWTDELSDYLIRNSGQQGIACYELNGGHYHVTNPDVDQAVVYLNEIEATYVPFVFNGKRMEVKMLESQSVDPSEVNSIHPQAKKIFKDYVEKTIETAILKASLEKREGYWDTVRGHIANCDVADPVFLR